MIELGGSVGLMRTHLILFALRPSTWPAGLIARAYLVRSMVTWLGARGIIAMALALGNFDPVRLSFPSVLQIVFLSVVLGMIDVRRRHESALLANLGVSRHTWIGLFAMPAVLGELAIGIATLAFG